MPQSGSRRKTSYLVDKGVARGIVVDAFRLFENELNRKLAAEQRLKDKKLRRPGARSA